MTETMVLQQMLAELEAHKLEVQLAPLSPKLRGYNEGGMKRVVVDAPPKWFRKLCGQYPSSRGVRRGKFDTKLKRRNILSTLRVLSEGRRTCSKYADDLRKIAASIK